MERDPGSALLSLTLPLVPLGARLTRLIGMKPWAHVVQPVCSVSTSVPSGSGLALLLEKEQVWGWEPPTQVCHAPQGLGLGRRQGADLQMD